MNKQILPNQVIRVEAEVRKFDINQAFPKEMRCPKCGDLLQVVQGYVYNGSPVMICQFCRSQGIYEYYYLAPKGAIT
jgi:uncharacterized protein with PIN domain